MGFGFGLGVTGQLLGKDGGRVRAGEVDAAAGIHPASSFAHR